MELYWHNFLYHLFKSILLSVPPSLCVSQ